MNNYNFAALNDKEFESFALDLLSAEFGIRIERFKVGKDRGVDGRWFADDRTEVIVQCKHWLLSGVDRLIAHLAKSERVKAERLKCSRYLLATSLSLSRANKQAIAVAMAPYVTSESDIIGAEDLNDLLGRHPTVERRHYKLWLSSTNVISLLLNNAIVGRSRAELDQIRYDSALFVETADYAAASRHLCEKRVVVLTGEPGIGKTTLARQLALEHAVEGFELVVLEESVSEAENVYCPDAKQFFYFDDFLGRTFLESLKAKQDSHVLRFIARVARDGRKRFVLTSRTNILNQGTSLSDLYADGQVVKNTYELRVKALSALDRARILYNHIWHSKLAAPFVDELYKEKRYHRIIKHKNFNPRLVAFVVDAAKTADVSADRYWSYVLSTFDDPEEVWSYFFSQQLSQEDRDLTYLVVLAGSRIGEAQLREGFFALPCAQPANQGLNDARFWKAVRHTCGSVLSRALVAGSQVVYELYNPSIADFAQAQLSKSVLWSYYYRRLRIVAALVRLEQIRSQPFIGRSEYRRILWALHEAETERGHPMDGYNLRLVRLLSFEEPGHPSVAEDIRRWLGTALNAQNDDQLADYLTLIKAADGILEDITLAARTQEIARYLEANYVPLDRPELVGDVLEALLHFDLSDLYDDLRSRVISDWAYDLDEQISANNVLSEYIDPKHEHRAGAELRAFVATQLRDFRVDPSDDEVIEICNRVDLRDVLADNIKLAMTQHDSSNRSSAPLGALSDDFAIDDLFERWSV